METAMTHNPFASLPGDLGQRAAALVAKRESEGLNVHFLRKDGTPARLSFATAERAAAFRANLNRRGLVVAD